MTEAAEGGAGLGQVIDQRTLVCLHSKPESYDQVHVWMTTAGHTHILLVCVACKLPYPMLLG